MLNANGHVVVTRFWLWAIGAEQLIPPRQIETEVAVGLHGNDGVVDTVHIRRHHKPAQHTVETEWNADVAVVEHGGAVQQHFEDQHCDGWRPEGCDGGKFQPHGKQNFDGMKAQAGCHIKFQIGVMHAVQTPERRHCVEHHMLKVDDEIKHDDGRNHGQPVGCGKIVEQAPAFLLGGEG